MRAVSKRLTYANVKSSIAASCSAGVRLRRRQGRQEERRPEPAQGQRGDNQENQEGGGHLRQAAPGTNLMAAATGGTAR